MNSDINLGVCTLSQLFFESSRLKPGQDINFIYDGNLYSLGRKIIQYHEGDYRLNLHIGKYNGYELWGINVFELSEFGIQQSIDLLLIKMIHES